MPYTRLAALMLAMTTLAVAGCGGSTTKTSSEANIQTGVAHVAVAQSATQALTRAELIKQGDVICRRLNQRAASLTTTSLHTVGTIMVPLIGYFHSALAELRTLKPPAAMAGAWNAMLVDVKRMPDVLAVVRRFALDNDMAATVKAELMDEAITRHRTAIARRNGFTDCAEF